MRFEWYQAFSGLLQIFNASATSEKHGEGIPLEVVDTRRTEWSLKGEKIKYIKQVQQHFLEIKKHINVYRT